MTQAATLATDTGSRTDLVRTRLLAITLSGSAVVAAVAMMSRPLAAEDWDDYAAFADARDATWLFTLVVGLSTGAAFLCLGLATCHLARRRGAILANAAAVLLGLGGLGFGSGFFASGALNWYATSSAVSEPAGTELMSYAGDHAAHVFAPQAAGFLLSAIGCCLVAAALWRAGSVPRWLALSVPTTLILMVMAGTGVAYDVMFAVFMASFVAVAGFVWRSTSAASVRR